MGWQAIYCVADSSGMTSNDLAHKLSISKPAARGLVNSLRKKGLLKKATESPTLAITQEADRQIFRDYE